jgi:hypothetical protein
MLTGKGTLPDCSKKSPLTGQPLSNDGSCNSIKSHLENPNAYYNLSAVTPGFVMAECPSPFLKDPTAKPGVVNNNNIYCRSGCCIPCPAQNYVSILTNFIPMRIDFFLIVLS